MRGETQLRAKRTRIKILRAIANSKGIAGFSEIKLLTGLSTGSIYYHLERMEDNYVIKSEKQYAITEQGMQLLRQIDAKNITPAAERTNEKRNDSIISGENNVGNGNNEETIKPSRGWDLKFSLVLGVLLVLITFVTGTQFLSAPALGIFVIHIISKNSISGAILPITVFHRVSAPLNFAFFRTIATAAVA